MSNKYFSTERRVWAKGVYAANITPPNDFTIASGAFLSPIVSIDQQALNPNSNIVINKVGLYSNFADGLVWKTVGQRLWLGITARVYTIDTNFLTGMFAITAGSKAVTGVETAFNTELADGDVFTNGGASGLLGTFVYRVNGNPPDAANLTLHDWPEQSLTMMNMRKLVPLGSDAFRRIEITTLNEMIDLDEFMKPSAFVAAGSVPRYVTLEMSFLNSAGLTFLTKSINTAFSGDSCFFDTALDIEFTAR